MTSISVTAELEEMLFEDVSWVAPNFESLDFLFPDCVGPSTDLSVDNEVRVLTFTTSIILLTDLVSRVIGSQLFHNSIPKATCTSIQRGSSWHTSLWILALSLDLHR